MKHDKKMLRKCSALAAAGAGVAVCITGGGDANAAKVTGLIAASNGDNTFNNGDGLKLFNNAVNQFNLGSTGGGIYFYWPSGYTKPDRANTATNHIKIHDAGETIGPALSWGASTMSPNVSDKYFGVRFSSETKYGWVHIVSTNGTASSMVLDKWGYENTGASIKTLGESVTAKKLGLADGTTKLMWSNANEDGVSRYEIQTKDASGAWTTVSSDAAGAGSYSATVPAGAQCRVMVEKVDGTAENIGF